MKWITDRVSRMSRWAVEGFDEVDIMHHWPGANPLITNVYEV